MPRSVVYWDECNTNSIGQLVSAVTKQGAAVIFGRTSDGGALSLTVLDGDNRIREYLRTSEEFEALVTYLGNMFADS